MSQIAKPKLWTPGDWNAFFGFGTNILVNLLVLTGLLRFVLKMPDDLVFGRILPATGLMLCMSTLYYAWLAYKLAKQTGRTDVCALPSGVSVPHMFVVVFVILGYLGVNPTTVWGQFKFNAFFLDTKDVATWVARLCTIVYFLFFFLMPWYTARDKVKPVPERVTYHH